MDTGRSISSINLLQANNRLFNHSVHLSSLSTAASIAGEGGKVPSMSQALAILSRIISIEMLGPAALFCAASCASRSARSYTAPSLTTLMTCRSGTTAAFRTLTQEQLADQVC